MKNPVIIIVLLFFFCLSLGAQTDSVYTGQPDPTKNKRVSNYEWKKDFTLGGNFQVWLGSSTFVLLTPTIGYIPFENMNVGIGAIYNYTSKDFGPYGRYSQSIFGGHSYVRYLLGENYFVQTQYDRLLQPDLFSSDPKAKTWVDYLFVGGGIRQGGEKVSLISSLMFNLTPNPLSIYPGRLIVQFGVVFGF